MAIKHRADIGLPNFRVLRKLSLGGRAHSSKIPTFFSRDC